MKDEPLLITIFVLVALVLVSFLFGGGRSTSARYNSDTNYRIPSSTYTQPAQASYAYTTYTTTYTPSTVSMVGVSCGARGGTSYTKSDMYGTYRVCYVPQMGECDEVTLVNQNVCVVPPVR